MTSEPLHFASALELAAAIRSGATDSRTLTRLFLDRIERGAGLSAYVHVAGERALALAEAADRLLAAGIVLGPLHGVPVAIKDAFAWEGTPRRGGSRALDERSGATSAVVRRLLGGGMVVLGKTAMTEFAFGLSGQNQTLGTARNAWDPSGTRAPGGSSSGAGVAVAAGLAPLAVGGDTGGSVRAPALLNHLVGYKPSSGLISRAGCLPLSETLDVVGPIARSVADAAALTAVLTGPDFDDPMTLSQPDTAVTGARPRRFAVLADEALPAPLQPEGDRLWRDALGRIEGAGLRVERWRPPAPLDFAQLGRDNSLVLSYEAYRHYGALAQDEAAPLWSVIRTRIRGGGDLTDAQYREALQRRRGVMDAFADEMRGFDGLVMPGADQAAQPLDPEDARHAALGAYLRPANFLGAAAIGLPSGRDRDGMPWGVQLLAPSGGDDALLGVAAEVERALAAGRPRPDLSGWGLD